MAIAAVPSYLRRNFNDASPGMRFGMYLELWGVNRRTKELLWTTSDIDYEVRGKEKREREVKRENKTDALVAATKLTSNDRKSLEAILARQAALTATYPESACLRLEARAVAPFTTGLGNEHPLENGFAFLNPYGLPYLPGSGVKGVLRQAARELAEGMWGETHGWNEEPSYPLVAGGKPVVDERKEPVRLTLLDLLFGRESGDGETDHLRGTLSFWDVVPRIEGDTLLVEIMTPHQGHYYQQGESPHDSGQPNPISFLTVPPDSGFSFVVTCDLARLERLAPKLARESQWKQLLVAAFEHAFAWLGFGAKSAVGYGQMTRDADAEREAKKVAEGRKQEAALAALSEEERDLRELRGWLEDDRNNGIKDAGGRLPNRLGELFSQADGWPQTARAQLADLAEEIYGYIGWGKKQKPEQRHTRIQALRENS